MAQAVRGAQFGLTLSRLFAVAAPAASEQIPVLGERAFIVKRALKRE